MRFKIITLTAVASLAMMLGACDTAPTPGSNNANAVKPAANGPAVNNAPVNGPANNGAVNTGGANTGNHNTPAGNTGNANAKPVGAPANAKPMEKGSLSDSPKAPTTTTAPANTAANHK